MSNQNTADNTIKIPPIDKAPFHTDNIFTWILYFIGPYKWIVSFFLGLRFVRFTVLALPPLLFGLLINALDDGSFAQYSHEYIIAIIVFFIVYLLAHFNLVFLPEVDVHERIVRAFTLFSIDHLNALPITWHEAEGSGKKIQRVMTARRGIQMLSMHLRWDILALAGDLIAMLFFIAIMDLPLHYIPLYVLFVSSYLFSSWYFARPYMALFDAFNKTFEKLASGVYEFVSAIKTVKAFNLSPYIADKALAYEKEGKTALLKAYKSNLLRWTIASSVGATWMGIFVFVGLHDTLNNAITSGAFAASFFLAYRMWMSCEIIGVILERLYEHGNGLHRMTQTLCITPENMDIAPLQTLPKDWKEITFNNATYIYENKANQGIKDISITIKRGEKIAFVGHSGAGKSTLMKVLMKQVLPQSGDLKIDNISVKNIASPQWLSELAFVPQDVELFNLSLRDNIVIDRHDIADEQLETALQQAALDDFITTLPDGLNTIIGERGVKLSGGQRQRLGIARALIRNAPILILDEATSSLDSVSEAKIQRAIKNSFDNHTAFIIAHRLSTIQNVDKIIVMDHGKIIEQGSFDTLIKTGGHFAKLWSMQTGDNHHDGDDNTDAEGSSN